MKEQELRRRARRAVAGAGGRGGTLKELAREVGVEADALRSVLERLEGTSEVVEWNRRWMLLDYTDWITGRIRSIGEGNALLIGEDRQARCFLPGRRLKGAVDGDLVLVKPLRRKADRGRARRGRRERLPEGSVLKVLVRRWERVVGCLEGSPHEGFTLVPFDPKTPLEVRLQGPMEHLEEDLWVVVETTPGPPETPEVVAGSVREILGRVDQPEVDTRVILRHHDIPESFPPEVVEESRSFPADPDLSDLSEREDLRPRTTVTIDGESARDFDDAISVERLSRGRYRLGVHIADVSHYVREGSPLDREAYRRGTSVYFPERAVPMLPEGLSNGLCSLRPEVPRLTLSVFLVVSPEGAVEGRSFAPSVIRSHRRLTYEEVRRLLEEPREGDREEYGPVLPLLREAEGLMRILYRERRRRGSIDFDLPSGDVILDTDGVVVGVRPTERHVAHRIIEELMIAANEAVALELESRERPALFRYHGRPELEDLEALQELLASFGLKLEGDLEDLAPKALQELLQEVEGHPEEGLVAALVLRAMQRAYYRPECEGHYALASPYYAHFTSPIRRYPDLVVHRALRAVLAGEETADPEAARERLGGMAEHTSYTERRAERAERELLQWKKVRFLADRVGDRFFGHVTGVQPFGLFIQLEEYLVDGLVPVAAMEDDYYHHEAEHHRLVGEASGRTFRLGQRVEVELAEVDLRRRELNLVMPDLQDEKGRGSGNGRRGRRRRRRRRGPVE